MELAIHEVPLESLRARALIARLNAELAAEYPEPGANHFRLDAGEVAEGRGAFFVAEIKGADVGCGAFRVIELPGEPAERAAEIKRMFVDPSARGRGVGRAILAAVEARAASLGVTRFVLETGDRSRAAVALYTRAGYARIPRFGEYVDSPLSVCFGKRASAVP